MRKQITTRERVLLAYGVLLVLLAGAALGVRNDQISSFNEIASESLKKRQQTVESALTLQDAEVANVLDKARKGGDPREWISSIDPNLISIQLSGNRVVSSSIPVDLKQSELNHFVNGMRGSTVAGGVPVEFWSTKNGAGEAVVLRKWDETRKALFEGNANCNVMFRAGDSVQLDTDVEKVRVRRSLMSETGKVIGTLSFEVTAVEIFEAKENANEAAGMILASAIAAMGVLFIILHRKVFEPLRIISEVLDSETMQPTRLTQANDEFGQTLRQLQKIFVQKHLLSSANEELERVVQIRTKDLAEAYDSTILGFSLAMELRDKETNGHCRRVAGMAVKIAEHLGIAPEEIVKLRRGALLHDVGKLGIPDSILLKAGPLTADEYELMQKHTIFGYEMLKPIPFLRDCLDIPLYHHECWDGSGYPKGLKGLEIPLSARIFALADVYDALRSDRPYRLGVADREIKEHIKSKAGTHFDPYLAAIFDRIDCNEFWQASHDLSDVAA